MFVFLIVLANINMLFSGMLETNYKVWVVEDLCFHLISMMLEYTGISAVRNDQ